MENILAIDLGKFKSCFCALDKATGEIKISTKKTSRNVFYKVFRQLDKNNSIVIYEAGTQSGWVTDMLREIKIKHKVANVCHPAWKWRGNEQKTDKNDAKRLLEMYNCNFFPEVYMPQKEVREKRSLLEHRQKIVGKILRSKNAIRGILTCQAIDLPTKNKCWTKQYRLELEELSEPFEQIQDCHMLWKGRLDLELIILSKLEETLKVIEHKLAELAKIDHRIELLKTIPGVGDRTAEALVYVLDNPHRFKNARHVSSYVGFVPRRYQSGNSDQSGGISRRGSRLLRSILVQAAWCSLACGWSRPMYKRIRQDNKKRTNIAIIAVARHILIRAWAMMRDDCCWDQRKFDKKAC